VFSQPIIKQLFSRYTLARLYTDDLPAGYPGEPSAAENQQFEQKNFGTIQSPLYVILAPLGDGKFEVVGRYNEGLIQNVPAFTDFLRQPLEKATASLTARN
jgi:hypothetical protein